MQSRLPAHLRRLASPFREFGPAAGTVYVVDRLLQVLSPACRVYLYELMAQPVPDGPLLPERRIRDLEFREIHAGDPDIARMPLREGIAALRFRQGAFCLGAYLRGALIGYVWFCRHAYEEDEVRCTYVLPEGNDSVFDFDLYILPERRMGIAFMAIWHGANEFLRGQGIRVSYSRMTRFNTMSRRSHRSLGARRTGGAIFLKLGRLEAMLATVPPFASLSVTGRPRLRLSPLRDRSG
ncbi:MAG: hypothetical protein KJ041_00865 [Gammaproteobacteria bacterium]|nr:hypothetical protein [Gammaproteobacteria bacterium]